MPFKSLKQSSKINLAGRQEQINNLRVFNDNVVEIVPLRLYEVGFTTETGLKLSLSIHLPDKFPNIKPVVEVKPPVIHPWVDILGTVDSPGLRNFAQHSDLGMVIQAIRREFDKTGIKVVARAAGSSSSGGKSAAATVPGQQQQAKKEETQSPTNQQVMDNVRSKLSELSVEDLKSILNDEDHFEKIMMEIEEDDKTLANLTESNSKMRDELTNKAKENQELQRQIEESRNLIICNYEEFHKKKSSLQETVDKLQEMKARIEPTLLADRLLDLSAGCDEESEEIAENFLQMKISVETFLPRYIESRGAGYLKKIKAEKVKKLRSDPA